MVPPPLSYSTLSNDTKDQLEQVRASLALHVSHTVSNLGLPQLPVSLF